MTGGQRSREPQSRGQAEAGQFGREEAGQAALACRTPGTTAACTRAGEGGTWVAKGHLAPAGARDHREGQGEGEGQRQGQGESQGEAEGEGDRGRSPAARAAQGRHRRGRQSGVHLVTPSPGVSCPGGITHVACGMLLERCRMDISAGRHGQASFVRDDISCRVQDHTGASAGAGTSPDIS